MAPTPKKNPSNPKLPVGENVAQVLDHDHPKIDRTCDHHDGRYWHCKERAVFMLKRRGFAYCGKHHLFYGMLNDFVPID